jgi:cysteine sulfinate desulfinase/cysteine desulfurase-like protein
MWLWRAGSLRLTFGAAKTSAQDVDYVLAVLPGIIERLQVMSPLAMQRVRKDLFLED